MWRNILFVLLISSLSIGQVGCKRLKKTQKATTMIGGYEKSKIYFKVQIGAFEKELASEDPFFEAIAGTEVQIDISPEGLFRYSLGEFKKYEEADSFEKELKGKGYQEAFVAAYGDDHKRIEMPMSEVLRLYNQ